MNTSEKELISEMLNFSSERLLGNFSIKSVVFKIVADYLNRLNGQDGFDFNRLRAQDFLTEVEQYLLQHVGEALPDLKSLASQFGMSESTFRRQFKKRYGVTMSAFFISSKMEYARQLLDQNHSVSNVAKLVGYQSVEKFSKMYKRHYKQLPGK
jgi:AraC-like DNA-binding protein